MAESYFKYCPNCQSAVPATAMACQACGWQFQTQIFPSQFNPAPQQPTQLYGPQSIPAPGQQPPPTAGYPPQQFQTPVPEPRERRTPWLFLILSVVMLVSLGIAIGAWRRYPSTRRNSEAAASLPAAAASAPAAAATPEVDAGTAANSAGNGPAANGPAANTPVASAPVANTPAGNAPSDTTGKAPSASATPAKPRSKGKFNTDANVVVTGHQILKALSITFLGETEQRAPKDGHIWVVCQLEVKSGSEKEIPVTTGDVMILGSDHHYYRGEMFPIAPAGVRQLAGALSKSNHVEGDVVFELPLGVEVRQIGLAAY